MWVEHNIVSNKRLVNFCVNMTVISFSEIWRNITIEYVNIHVQKNSMMKSSRILFKSKKILFCLL